MSATLQRSGTLLPLSFAHACSHVPPRAFLHSTVCFALTRLSFFLSLFLFFFFSFSFLFLSVRRVCLLACQSAFFRYYLPLSCFFSHPFIPVFSLSCGQGYLYAYVCFLDEELSLTLITGASEDFFPLKECKARIVDGVCASLSLSSHLISSHLISSHLRSSLVVVCVHPSCSHLISSHLRSSHVFVGFTVFAFAAPSFCGLTGVCVRSFSVSQRAHVT